MITLNQMQGTCTRVNLRIKDNREIYASGRYGVGSQTIDDLYIALQDIDVPCELVTDEILNIFEEYTLTDNLASYIYKGAILYDGKLIFASDSPYSWTDADEGGREVH